jgi:regulatory protein
MTAFRRRAADGDAPLAPADLQAHALRLLGRRELSRHQLRARLLERSPDAGTVEAVLTNLADRGLLDDRRVAAAFARTSSQVKRRGRDRILRELAQMGISGDIAREAVDEVCGDEAEDTKLDTVLRRRARGLDLADPAVTRRLMGALLRQGFEGDDIRRALARARAADPGGD